MLKNTLGFLSGILLVQQFSLLPDFYWYYFLPLIVIFIRLRYGFILFVLIGFMWALTVAQQHLAQRLKPELEAKVITIEGRVVGLPKYSQQRVKFDFKITHPHHLPAKIRLSWYFAQQQLKAGQRWRFSVKLKRPHGFFNRNGFDYERWLLVNNIGATGYIRKNPTAVLLAEKPVWQSISAVRQQIAIRLEALLANNTQLGLIKALTIGDKQAITQSQWRLFRETGTIHLMAISGLHIGLVAGLVYWLGLKFWASCGFFRWSPPQVATILALVVAGFYALLAGLSLPTQRALIMLSVLMLSLVLKRQLTTTHSLAFTLFAVLVFQPLAVLSIGFWMSFLSVSIVFYCVSGRETKLPNFWLLKRIKQSQRVFIISLTIALVLAPLSLFFFQKISLISPIANVIAIPLVNMIVIPLLLLAVLSLFIFPLMSQALLEVIAEILQKLMQGLALLADLPIASISGSTQSISAVVLAMLGGLLLLAPQGMIGRWLAIIFFIPLVFT